MKGDYLWDGSGEPDPDVQHLERTLGKLRHKGRAPMLPVVTPHRRRLPVSWLAVAAALVVMALVGLWSASRRQAGVHETAPQTAQQQALAQDSKRDSKDEERQERPSTATPKAERPLVALSGRKASSTERPRAVTPEVVSTEVVSTEVVSTEVVSEVMREAMSEAGPRDGLASEAEASEIAALSNITSNITMTGVDSEMTRHIEKAQLLLRSFRNVHPNQRRTADVSYERKLSKALLYKNIVLRRDAEARGEEPVAQLLGDLEPYLIDIANLPGRASREEIASIKGRMQKKEIVATLQVYSLQASNQIY